MTFDIKRIYKIMATNVSTTKVEDKIYVRSRGFLEFGLGDFIEIVNKKIKCYPANRIVK